MSIGWPFSFITPLPCLQWATATAVFYRALEWLLLQEESTNLTSKGLNRTSNFRWHSLTTQRKFITLYWYKRIRGGVRIDWKEYNLQWIYPLDLLICCFHHKKEITDRNYNENRQIEIRWIHWTKMKCPSSYRLNESMSSWKVVYHLLPFLTFNFIQGYIHPRYPLRDYWSHYNTSMWGLPYIKKKASHF